VSARPQFDPDAAYLVHPHTAEIHYQPFPADTLHALADIRTLQRHTQDPDLMAWLDDRAAFLTAHCADCPPLPVRHTEPQKRDRQRHETKYAMRGAGPTNKSGKAKS